MLTLDTSALIAILNRRDPHHSRVRRERDNHRGPYFVPAGILSEITYLVARALGPVPLDALLQDLESGAYTLDCGERDFTRIRQLVSRYDDLSLGFADAAVIACAERRTGHVLTLDRRDFDVVARGERTITVLPA